MNILSPKLVKSSLGSHSWLGLAVGGLMYIICLSGTVTIFYEEIERWEQPVADEFLAVDPQLAEASFNAFMADPDTAMTEHMYLVFPNEALPRLKVATDQEGYYLNQDGSRGEVAHDALSGLLNGLHIYLHMPVNIGIIVVSAMGAILCGLIISGFLAHPSIVRDAFKLRAGGNGRLGQVDLHNRLSVWGAPFHLMIALTGAYVGLIMPVVYLFAAATEGATAESMTAEVFPAEPALVEQAPVYEVARALETVREQSPDGRLLYLIVHDAPSDSRFMEFYVQEPGMLSWSETYRFDTSGNFLGAAGYNDQGARQTMYSVYRLHFGHFGGFITKLFYVVLGLSLTVVSASGINIWLEKRKYRDPLNLLWPGVVWGMPLALVAAAFTQAILHVPATSVFWLTMIVAMLAGLFSRDEVAIKKWLQGVTGISLLLLVAGHAVRYGDAAFAAGLPVNMVLIGLAGLFLAMTCYRRQQPADVIRPGALA